MSLLSIVRNVIRCLGVETNYDHRSVTDFADASIVIDQDSAAQSLAWRDGFTSFVCPLSLENIIK
jgi:hypothetical protein